MLNDGSPVAEKVDRREQIVVGMVRLLGRSATTDQCWVGGGGSPNCEHRRAEGWRDVRCAMYERFKEEVTLTTAHLPRFTKQHYIFRAPSSVKMQQWWNDTDGGNSSVGTSTCLSGTPSAKNLTWTDLGSYPVPRGKRMANDILSHGG